MPIEKIVLLEDDENLRQFLEDLLRQKHYVVACAPTLAAAREYLAKDTFDLVFADVNLPDGQGTQLLLELRSLAQRPLVVIMTGFGTVESAVECMRNGAFDYLLKPFSSEQIEVVLDKAENYARLLQVNRFLSQEEDAEAGCDLLGHGPAMVELRQLIRQVARTEATVLIQGESGTGKELVARALHRQSPRSQLPFIRVNCAAIPENLIESEFFGHERGAFTGAVTKREGRFELAHGGTILLDEISEISPTVQAKLLRVLQEREFERVGGTRTIKVDVRVIATTNRRLEESVAQKEFRQDLFFRLNVVPIHVPPLRQRREDIPVLAGQFLQRYARKHGGRVRALSDASLAALNAHDWPGNVRELQNVIERAVILSGDAPLLEPGHLGLPTRPAETPSPTLPRFAAPSGGGGGVALDSDRPLLPAAELSARGRPAGGAGFEPLPLAEVEKRHILAMLNFTGGNRTHAARQLQIGLRTLRNKLNEYGVSRADSNREETWDPETEAESPRPD